MEDRLKWTILEIVTHHSPIKDTTLGSMVVGVYMPRFCDGDEYQEAVEELTKDGEIIELEYTDPETPYRIKSIYFKKGTKFMNLKESHGECSQDIVDRDSIIHSEVPHSKM